MSTDPRAGTIAGDVSEWLCDPCRTIHPPPPGKPWITHPCPDCGSYMVPTSSNVREIERLRGLLEHCHCQRGSVVGYQAGGHLYAPCDVTVWREPQG